MLIFIINFISYFFIFSLLRLAQCIFAKEIYIKYIIVDSLILGLYFGFCISFNDLLKINTNPGEDALLGLTGFVIIPYVYSFIKKFRLKNHPKLSNMYYPVWEFILYIVGLIGGTVWSELLNRIFIG